MRLGTGTPGAFTTPVSVPVGSFPIFGATADMNNDGYADLITANNEVSGSVSIALGNGNGTFAAAASFSTFGSGPLSVATGDYNGDGKTDLAVGKFGTTGTVTILLGNGDGTFTVGGTNAVDNGASTSVAADFNGDNKTDLAVANANGSTVSVLIGNGNGTFAAAASLAVGSGPRGLTAGDFNNDGKTDLATADYSGGSASILLGNGNGTFAAPTTVAGLPSASAVTSGDFNADGKTDLAVTSGLTNGKVTVLLGNGAGAFPAVRRFAAGSNPNYVLTNDFDGDDRLDLAIANRGSGVAGSLTVLSGVGNGAFTRTASYGLGATSAEAIAANDFNGDGRIDFAVANYTGNSVTLLLNQLKYRSGFLKAENGALLLSGIGGSFTLNYDKFTGQMVVTGTSTGTERVFAAALPSIAVFSIGTATVNFDLGTALGFGRVANVNVLLNSTVNFNTSQHLNAITDSGNINLAAGGNKVLVATSFAINRINLNDNAIILNYATPGTAAITQVKNSLTSGRNGGAWTGAGSGAVRSGTAAANAAQTTGLGFMEALDYKSINGVNALFAGETIDTTAVLIRYTYYGDTDLDGGVSINDFNRLSTGFGGATGKLWINGDFDFDGGVSINDFNLLSANFGKSLPSPAMPLVVPVKKGLKPARQKA